MNGALEGLLAGSAGTAALAAFERMQGPPPIFAPERIAARMLGSTDGAKALGNVLRALYGPSLGLAWRWVLGKRASRHRWGGLAAGFGTLVLELEVMPRVGATPPLSRWSSRDVASLYAQTLVFGLTFAAVLRSIHRS